MDVRMVVTKGSVEIVEALERGEIELGIVTAGDAYFAMHESGEGASDPSHRLKAIALAHVLPFHLVVRSGLRIRDVGALRGRTVGSGLRATANWKLAQLVLSAFGVNPETVRRTSSVGASNREELTQLADGTLDAELTLSYYSAPPLYAAVQRGARLFPLEGPAIDKLRGQYPFIRLVSIPAGTYPGQREAVHTIGVDTVLICRDDLAESLVYELTRTFFDAVPTVFASLPIPVPFMDPDTAAATPISLHEGAAMYYRELELSR
jgi:hypothetical protein